MDSVDTQLDKLRIAAGLAFGGDLSQGTVEKIISDVDEAAELDRVKEPTKKTREFAWS